MYIYSVVRAIDSGVRDHTGLTPTSYHLGLTFSPASKRTILRKILIGLFTNTILTMHNQITKSTLLSQSIGSYIAKGISTRC